VLRGGSFAVNNAGHEAIIRGSLNINNGGTLLVGFNTDGSILSVSGNGRLQMDGTMIVGGTYANTPVNSTVNVNNAIVTGSLQIFTGSTFRISDILTVGSPPSLHDEKSDASVSGVVALNNAACVLVYGSAKFNEKNIKYESVSTEFRIFEVVYAKEYKYTTTSSKRTLVFPSISNLIDYDIAGWVNERNSPVSPDSNVQIGSGGHKIIKAVGVTQKTYTLTLAKDESIRWVVNGVVRGSSEEIDAWYDAPYSIGITSSGSTSLPTLYVNGVPHSDSSISFKVTKTMTFTTSNHYLEPDEGASSLTIALGVIIVVLALALIVLVIQYKKKNK
jgi:hypothetical protein